MLNALLRLFCCPTPPQTLKFGVLSPICFCGVFARFGYFLACLLVSAVLTGDVFLSYWLFCLSLLFVYLDLGVLVGRYRLSQGGSAIAKRMGAVRLFIDQNADYQDAQFFETFIRAGSPQAFPSSYARAYEFTQQIGLAAGVAMPALYVLPNQQNINACVAGFDDKDTVMIISQGALDNLSNEALYALIAHQYSAILHGDAHLNLKVGMMSASLSWLYESADWLEQVVLGKFDADYHGGQRISNQPLTKSDWVNHWHQDHGRVHKPWHNSRQDEGQMAVALLLSLLFVFGCLFILRLVGLLGMLSHDWIVSRFNRERSFLADATSMQLTRSDGIILLLQAIQKHSCFLSGAAASHLGYFFFAPIGEHQEFFDTHPSLNERLDKLGAGSYVAFGRAMIEPIDQTALQKSHTTALNYAPVVALTQELLIQTIEYVAAPADTVVDGRLVVNEAWFDWSTDQETPQTQTPSFVLTQLTTDHDLPSLITLQNLKQIQLPWLITKYLRTPLGTLLVIEGLLLMRFERVSFDKVTLGQIYGEPSECVYLHEIGEELLCALAQLDRRCDGALLLLAIKKFGFHLNNPAIALTKKQQKLLKRYHDGLLTLKTSTACDLPKNQKELLQACERFWCALVLANVCQILNKKHALSPKVVPANEGLAILLAFLVSVQDNSLLTGQTAQVLAHLVRLCRLACIEQVGFDELYVAHRLGVLDWVALLLGLSALPNKKRAIETLASACYHDGVLAQKEHDTLELLGELLHD